METRVKTKATSDRRPIDRRSPSRGTLDLTVTIASESAHKMLRKHYKDVSIHTYHMTDVMAVNGLAEQSEKCRNVLDQMFGEVMQGISADHAAMKELAKQRGISGNVRFKGEEQITLEVSSHGSSQFISLVLELDKLVKTLELLKIVGELTEKQRYDGSYKWEKVIANLAGRIRNMSQQLRKITKKGPAGKQPGGVRGTVERIRDEATPELAASEIPVSETA